MSANTNRQANAELELRPLELTEDQLDQITGGTTPSIPIPPPTPHAYARMAANSTMQSDVVPQ